ncbi:MAG: hypothetical protein ACTIKA_09295 [Psychroflexus halocasei]|uniref:hypothetical protein n=1 Tax=Psychroflexus sp. S27 TaxID=1982757 RepID=UPI0018642498|nr:hypothetical protein [Psychroflexus sp. S27]
MKKFFTIIALGAMTIGMSSFGVAEVSENQHDDCVARANSYGDFMDGYDGMGSLGHAFRYYTTFCVQYPING